MNGKQVIYYAVSYLVNKKVRTIKCNLPTEAKELKTTLEKRGKKVIFHLAPNKNHYLFNQNSEV